MQSDSRFHRFVFTIALLLLTYLLPANAGSVYERWTATHGLAGRQDYARTVAVDSAGNVIVAGELMSSSSLYKFGTIKYSGTDGSVIWQAPSDNTTQGSCRAYGIAVDTVGDVVVTGVSSLNFSDYYTAKYSGTDGRLLWEKRYNGTGGSYDQAFAVALDKNGDVIVTGVSQGITGGTDCYTAKYAGSDGTLLWEKRYNGPGNGEDYGSAVTTDAEGNVVVVGTASASEYNGNCFAVKYSGSNGSILWEKVASGTGLSRDYFRSVAVDADGNVVATGHAFRPGKSDDYYTAKYAAADGAVVWEKHYGSPDFAYDRASAVAVDSTGNVIVTGISSGVSSLDYYTVKYAAIDGALLWEKRYSAEGASDDAAWGIVLDAGGNAIVTGHSQGQGSTNPHDFYTAKYASSDGGLLWEARHNGPGFRDDVMDWSNPIALTPDGGVVIVGASESMSSISQHYDFRIVKYLPVAAPVATTGIAANVTSTSAELRAAVNPNGGSTTVSFQYGLTEALDTSVPATFSPIGGGAPLTVQAAVQNLAPHTSYHFRVVAQNSEGTVYGEIATFSTENSWPMAQPDSLHIEPDAAVVGISVLANDSDPDGDPLSISAITQGTHGTVAITGSQLTYTPGSGFLGKDSFTYTISDGYGKTATAQVSVRSSRPVIRVEVHAGKRNRGEAINVDGEAAGTTWSSFGTPSTTADGIGALAFVQPPSPGKLFTAVAHPLGRFIAATERPAPGVSGANFVGFSDPVFAGEAAGFVGNIKGTGINKSNDTGLWANRPGGPLRLLAREGGKVATQNLTFSQFVSYALPSPTQGMLVLAKLKRDALVNSGSDLLLAEESDIGLVPIFRTGTPVMLPDFTSQRVQSLRLLAPVAGSPGQRRSYSTTGWIMAAATFDNKTAGLLRFGWDREATVVLHSSSPVPGLPDARWANFGQPAVNGAGEFAFLGALMPRFGGVAAGDAAAIFASSPSSSFVVAARSGRPAPGLSGVNFATLSDPALNDFDQLAFLAKITGSGVSKANSDTLWWGAPGALKLAARTGTQAEEVSDGALWKKLVSYVLPDRRDAGPIFLATLLGKGVKATNNTGLWAVDTSGQTRLLLRTGIRIQAGGVEREIRLITTLAAVPGSSGQGRSCGPDGSVAVKLGFSDGTQALARIFVP